VSRTWGFLKLVGISNAQHPWLVRAQHLRRRIFRIDERLKEDYFGATSEPKLQIGGGWHQLEGWLNTDLELVPGVMTLDATRLFPFADESFQFIFTEHMIEHVSCEAGARMLRECHRVLRRGGVIRVTTPDLGAIVGLANENLSHIQRQYLSWFCSTFVPKTRASQSAALINAHFRLWGHEFIYDEETLANALYAAGFSSVKRWRLCESDHEALQDLENTQRYPDGLLDFESMALEARK